MKKIYDTEKNCFKGFIIFIWFVIMILISFSVFAESMTIEKSETAELHNLSNEKLLSQALAAFDEASYKFSAQLRGVSKNEILIEHARQKTGLSDIPKEKPMIPAEDSEDAKIRLDALTQRLGKIEAEKELLDKQIGQIESARSAAQSFISIIEELYLFSIEIRLRIQDGTLSDEEIPGALREQNLEVRKQKIINRQGELRQKAEAVRKELEETLLRIREAKKAVMEADAYYSSAQKRDAQELKQKGLEKEYSDQMPEKLITKISELQEERIWLKSSLVLSHNLFHNIRKNIEQIQKELGELSEPETAKSQEIPPEDAQKRDSLAKEVTAYYNKRIEKLTSLRSASESLIKQGEVLEGDATVLSEHIFRMRVIANILELLAKEEKIPSDSVPPETHSEILIAAGNTVSKIVSDVLASAQKAREQVTYADNEINKSEAARKEAKKKLANLKKTYDANLQARKWEAELRDLTSEQIISKFHEITKKLQGNQLELQTRREEYEKAKNAVSKARQKLESLKDPLQREAEQESLDEKQNILKKLYDFAGLEFSAEKIGVLSDPETSTEKALRNSPSAELLSPEKKQTGITAEPSKDTSVSKAEAYQNMLSARVRIIGEQQKHHTDLSDAFQSLNQKLEQYIKMLTETSNLAQQHLINAVELKKRIGRGQIKNNEIPDGISEALKQDLLTQLEDETAKSLNYQMYIRYEIENSGKKDGTVKETQVLLTEIQALIGKRLDIIRELGKLEQNFGRKQDMLSKTEQKTLEQTALRRLKSQDRMAELLLGFIRTEEDKSLTRLLQSYYQELIGLEDKQENLKIQKEKTEISIRLAEEEKTLILKLLPLLKKQREQLENQREEEWVKIRVQLMPDKAEEILSHFEAKNGQYPLRLPAVPEKERIPVIEKGTELLFEQHIRIVAANKWTRLFEHRLSPKKIDAEIGIYQDKLGDMNAKDAAILRRIQYISGHSQDELAKIPKTESGQIRFQDGEIGILRADRYKLRSQGAIRIFIKLTAIFLTAIFLIWLVNHMIERSIQRPLNSGEQKSPQTLVVLRLLRTLLKLVIWIMAIIAGLQSIGFNVGAIITGLGIGGLAIAMASKETLANILGGVTIFTSKMFKVGDLIRIKGHEEAIVREIGIRSTRLEDFKYNTIYTVPNSIFSESIVENISSWSGKLLYQELRLSRDANTEQLELAIELIKDVILNHQDINKLDRVIFRTFDDYSYVIYYVYNITEFKKRHIVRGDVNVRIHKKLAEHNIPLACLPTYSVSPSL